jgi:hypothetical protein
MKELIEKHQTCIEIIDAILFFKRRIKLYEEWIHGFPGTFPGLRRKYERNIEIQNMCIARLLQRYKKALSQINNM